MRNLAALAIVAAFATSARTETYRFESGHTDTNHDHRCGSGKNIDDWVATSALEIGSDGLTLTVFGSAYAGSRSSTFMFVEIKDTHTVVIEIAPFECVDASCSKGMRATYSVIRHERGDQPRCFERWSGVARTGAR